MIKRDDNKGHIVPSPSSPAEHGIPFLRPDFRTRAECDGRFSAVLGYQTDRYRLVVPGLDELSELTEQERDTVQN